MERSYAELDILPDATLLTLARQGDNAAINVLFSRHTLYLRRIAFRYLKNQADSDDAVQDGLMSAYLHLSKFEGRARFKTWLVKIVVNAAQNRIRSRSRHRAALSVEEGMQDSRPNPLKTLLDPGIRPDEVFAVQERKRIVAESLRDIPSSFRPVLYLYYMKELPLKEAAFALGVKPETLKTKLFRGRRILATHHHFALLQTGNHPSPPLLALGR